MTDADVRARFKTVVLGLDRGCILDHRHEGVLQAHHVITQQQLRKAGQDDLLWDPANGATVCERGHRRHHSALERIPADRLPARCLGFAIRHGFDDLIRRYYPSL